MKSLLLQLSKAASNKAKEIRNANLRTLRLLIYTIMLISAALFPGLAFSQISLSISKINNASTPVPSGQPFTYTITYSWSGGAPGTLYIEDNVPSQLDVLSAMPGSPNSIISGNLVRFTIGGLTLPSGSGTVQINARFKPGVTCGGVRACNKAGITVSPNFANQIMSNDNCVTSDIPTNKWQFEKEWIAGCAVDDQVIFRIKIVNPAGSDIGGINLNNVTINDILPSGAVVQSVTGSWTGISGTTLTGGPTSLGVSPWTQWYVAYLTVKFPSPTFFNGQLLTNTATMTYSTPCNTTLQAFTDTADVTLCQGVIKGYIGKYLSLSMYFPNNPSWYPVFTPGCCGTYTIYYNNSGTVTQTGLVIEDDFPSSLDLNKITTSIPPGTFPVTLDVFCWTGTTCSTVPCTSITYNAAGTQVLTGLPANVCKVRWTYGGSIPVTQYIWNYLDVCVRSTDYITGLPVLAGQNIVNKVTASAAGMPPVTATHTKPVDNTAPKVVATKLFIGGCNASCNVTPYGPYQPGDTVRFRMAVTNIGNANASPCTITDNLPSGLTYVGNETYYYGTFNWMVNIYNPQCCSLNVTVPSAIGGTITKPPSGASNLTWTFPVLPGRCDGLVDYFIIDFDVKISDNPPAPAGQYTNTFTFSAGNVLPVISNVAILTVNTTAQVQVIKEVRGGTNTLWNNSATIIPGGAGTFRLTVKNTGNSQLSNLCLLDIMPWIGDIKVLPAYSARNSMFNLPYDPANGLITSSLTGYFPTYSSAGLIPSRNPLRSTECGGFCGVLDPPGAVSGAFATPVVQTYSFKINANTGVNLAPGASLQTSVPFKLPISGLTVQASACNSFAVQAIPLGLSGVCLSAESNPACVNVGEVLPCFVINERRIVCLGYNDGHWVYQLSFNITNNSGTGGSILIVPNAGTISSITPSTLPPNVPTAVTANYQSSTGTGVVCFTIKLIDEKQNIICDSTFCFDLPPCPQPCPCPFKINTEKPHGFQGSGNNIGITNLFSISGANVLKLRATISSITVTQVCKYGTTTYTPPATIIATNWHPSMATGFGTGELTWTDLECPPVTGANLGLLLNVPSAPGKNCYQTITICIRYTVTDCKCNTCDTTVCYTLTRKWTPWHEYNGTATKSGAFMEKNANTTLAADENILEMVMSSATEGKLTLHNPGNDEFTYGATIYSITLGTNSSVKPVSMTVDGPSVWTSGGVTDSTVTSRGILDPGNDLTFDVVFTNPQQAKSWKNLITVVYMLNNKDTLTGTTEVTSRIPSAMGGDEFEHDETATKALNAKTFVLKFICSNFSDEKISTIDLKVNNSTILAVGPGVDATSASLASFKLNNGAVKLLTSLPDKMKAVEEAMEANTVIGPIYLTFTSAGENPIKLDYSTYNSGDELVTSGSIDLKVSSTGIIKGEENEAVIRLFSAIPNPANSSALIQFELSNDEPEVKLYVTDAKGSIVSVLLDNTPLAAGLHKINFTADKLPSGSYYFTIRTRNASQTGKLMIIK